LKWGNAVNSWNVFEHAITRKAGWMQAPAMQAAFDRPHGRALKHKIAAGHPFPLEN
jgi:hypothetical protein